MTVDLSTLPDLSFIEKDAAIIEADGIALYEAITGRTLSPGDPERLFVEALLYKIALLQQKIDHAAKMNLVAYAEGDHLDHLGARVDCTRLAATAAVTTFRFVLAAALTEAVTIPAGTRGTPDNALMFATDEALVIAAGETAGDVGASCTTVGADGNGFLAGQIAKLVDAVPYVAGVSNITMSAGGSDEERDDRCRERVAEAPRSYSVAGPKHAYRWWAKTAHQDIIDVSYRSPTPGVVELRPLMKGGELPAQEILDAVLDIVAADSIRPDTDSVAVLAPETVSYVATVSYWIAPGNAVTAIAIQAKVDAAHAEWLIWQRSKLGRNIDPSELVHRLKAAGAGRVSVTLPAYTTVEKHQVAVVDAANSTLTYEGLEDE